MSASPNLMLFCARACRGKLDHEARSNGNTGILVLLRMVVRAMELCELRDWGDYAGRVGAVN
jgi:hypothetical protein